MSRTKPLPQDELQALNDTVNRGFVMFRKGEYEEGLKVLEGVIPVLKDEFRKFEWSDPIDAHHYAKQLGSEGQAQVLKSVGVKKINDLKGKTIPHPYFSIIQQIYHDVLYSMSLARGEKEQWETAIECMENAIATKKGVSDDWISLGTLNIHSGNAQVAGMCFRKAIKCNPEEERFWSNIGKFYEMRNRQEEHAIVVRTLALLGESKREVLYNLVDLCWFGGDVETAMEVLLQLTLSNPDDPDVLLRLARIKVLQNDYDKAVRLLNEALEKGKKRADIHGELGRILAIQGKNKDASKALERSLKISQDPQFKYLYLMIKKGIDTTSHINIISAVGERQFRVHMGMKIPLGMSLLELLHNISNTSLGAKTFPFGFETTFVKISDKENGTISVAIDPISMPLPNEIFGREPGEFSASYSESFSEINYIETGYRPQDSLVTIPLQYNAIYLTNADVTPPDNFMMPMIPGLVKFHDIKFSEKKKELLG